MALEAENANKSSFAFHISESFWISAEKAPRLVVQKGSAARTRIDEKSMAQQYFLVEL